MSRLHRYWFGQSVVSDVRYPNFAKASGTALVSSAADMGRLLRVHLNGGALDGRRILSEDGTRALHEPPPLSETAQRYAFGWSVGFPAAPPGQRHLFHVGSGADNVAFVSIAPDLGWGLVVLINARSYLSGPDVIQLPFQIRRLLVGVPTVPIQRGKGVFTPLLLGLFLLLALQLAGIARTVRLARSWRQRRGARPGRRAQLLRHIVLPGVTGVLWVIALLVGVPRAAGVSFSLVGMFAPDAALLALASVTIAAAWTPLRTVLLLLEMRAADVGSRATEDGDALRPTSTPARS